MAQSPKKYQIINNSTYTGFTPTPGIPLQVYRKFMAGEVVDKMDGFNIAFTPYQAQHLLGNIPYITVQITGRLFVSANASQINGTANFPIPLSNLRPYIVKNKKGLTGMFTNFTGRRLFRSRK